MVAIMKFFFCFKQCPWATPQNPASCSLSEVMSEELAKELQLEEEAAAFPEVGYVTHSAGRNRRGTVFERECVLSSAKESKHTV